MKMRDAFQSIGQYSLECECGWNGTIATALPDADDEGALGCPECDRLLDSRMPPAPRRLGRMRISFELLVEILHLPIGIQIERIISDIAFDRVLEIVVAHPDLPIVRDKEIIQYVKPQYKHTWHPAYTETEFDQWVY